MFLVNTSQKGAQIYDLVTTSSTERKTLVNNLLLVINNILYNLIFILDGFDIFLKPLNRLKIMKVK